MKKMIKRITAVAIAIAMFVTMAPIDGIVKTASAEEYDSGRIVFGWEDGYDTIFTGQQKELICYYEGDLPDGYRMDLVAGFKSSPESDTFIECLDENGEYVYQTDRYIFDGNAIYGRTPSSCHFLDIVLTVYNGSEIVETRTAVCGIRESVEDYHLENEIKILPDWNHYINSNQTAWIENGDYPDGTDYGFKILDMFIDNQSPDDGDGDVVSLKRVEDGIDDEDPDNDDYHFEIEGLNYGYADVVIQYEDLDGVLVDYHTNVYVLHDLYSVNVNPETDRRTFLPGESIHINTEFFHQADREIDEHEDDNIEFRWRTDYDADDIAELTVDSSHTDQCTVNIKTLPDGVDNINRGFRVYVEVYKDGDKVCENSDWFNISDSFITSYPISVGNLWPGDSMILVPELRMYDVKNDHGYDQLDITSIRFNYSDNDLELYDAYGSPLDSNDEYEIGERDLGGSIVSGATGTEFMVVRKPYADYEFDMDMEISYINSDGNPDTYYGRIHFDWFDTNVRFDMIGGYDFFTDGSAELAFDLNRMSNYADYGYTLSVKAGDYDYGNEEWNTQFTEDYEYSVDYVNNIITFDGQAIASTYGLTNGGMDIHVFIEIKNGDDEVIVSRDWSLRIESVEERYDLPESREMLPGWDEQIDRYYNGFIRNSIVPGGDDFQFEIKDVQIYSENPDVDGQSVVAIKKEYRDDDTSSDDYWWKYRAMNNGLAILKVIYDDYFGDEQTKLFAVRVQSDVFDVGISAKDGVDIEIPGESVYLTADVQHHTADGDVDTDDCTYRWRFVDEDHGYDYATLVTDPDHPESVEVKLRDLDPGETFIHEDFRVEVIVYCGVDDHGNPVPVCKNDIWVTISSDYCNITPLELDDIDPGVSITVPFSVVHTSAEGGDETIDNVHFKFHYNSDVLQVYDSNGLLIGNEDEYDNYIDSSYTTGDTVYVTIKRINDWHAELHVDAEWDDSNGDSQSLYRRYEFWDKNMDIWFERDNDHVLNDKPYTFTLNTGNLGDIVAKGYSISFTVGRKDDSDPDWFENDAWDICFTEDDDYTVNGNEVTVNIPDLYNDGNDSFVIKASIISPDGTSVVTGTWDEWWIDECEERYDLEGYRDMLVGWDGNIHHYQHGFIRNSDEPDGREFQFEVTDVEKIYDSSDNPRKPVVNVRKDYKDGDTTTDDYWWHYETYNTGEADLKVTYLDVNGDEQEHIMHIHVGQDVYSMHIDFENGDKSLPGETKAIEAFVRHETLEGDVSTDGVSFEWNIIRGSEWASIYSNPSEPKKAYVTFANLPDGMRGIWEDVEVEAIVYEGFDPDTGDPIERCSDRITLHLADSYDEVYPLELEDHMNVGDWQYVNVNVRRYPAETVEGYELLNNIHCRWYYDPNCIEIFDMDDNLIGNNDEFDQYIDSASNSGQTISFKIHRIGDWDTDINLRVDCRSNDPFDDSEWEIKRDFNIDRAGNIWFEKERHDIFNDQTFVTSLNTDDLGDIDAKGYTVNYKVGIRGDSDNWAEADDWNEVFDEGTDYIVSGNKIYVDIPALYGDRQDNLAMTADVISSDGTTVVASACQDWWVNECENFYNLRGYDELLVGWDGNIPRFSNGHIRNSNYPDGEDFEFEVKDVVKIYDSSDDPEDPVINLKKDYKDGDTTSDDYWWHYDALNTGDADLQVTYVDVNGYSQLHILHIHVGQDIYSVNISCNDGSISLPGGTKNLEADIRHETLDGDVSTDEAYVDWEVIKGGEWIDFTVDPSDSKKAKVQFHNLPDGMMGIWEEIIIKARVYEGEDPDTHDPIERCDQNINLFISDSYDAVYPMDFDGNMEIGQIQYVNVNVRHYPAETVEGYELIESIHCRWYYDPDSIEIYDMDDNLIGNNDEFNEYIDSAASYGSTVPFKIKRISDVETRIFLNVDCEPNIGWPYDYNDWTMDREYQINGKDYNIWFDETHVSVSDDSEVDLDLNSERLPWNDDNECDVEYRVGRYNTSEGRFDLLLNNGTDYTISADGKTITIKGSAIADAGLVGVDVEALAYVNGYMVSTEYAWVELEQSGPTPTPTAAPEVGYDVTFDTDSHASITAYKTQDYDNESGKMYNVTSVKSMDSTTGEPTDVDGQVNFTIVCDEGYVVDTMTVLPTTNYKNLKNPSDTGRENTYRVTKISGPITVTVTTRQTSAEQTKYTATFVTGEHFSITTYDKQDYTDASIKHENATSAVARNSDTGEIDSTGEGQINFEVVPDEGYVVDTVTAVPADNYKNLKLPEELLRDNTYRLTKVKGDITVTVTVKEAPVATPTPTPTASPSPTPTASPSPTPTAKPTEVPATEAPATEAPSTAEPEATTAPESTADPDVAPIGGTPTPAPGNVTPLGPDGGTVVIPTADGGTQNIVPAGTTLKKLIAGKKKITITWNKQTEQTTGYIIQYGLKKSFKGAKKKTITKNTKVKWIVKKLKSKKYYFVRICTYYDYNGTRHLSAWSKAKKIKVK